MDESEVIRQMQEKTRHQENLRLQLRGDRAALRVAQNRREKAQSDVDFWLKAVQETRRELGE